MANICRWFGLVLVLSLGAGCHGEQAQEKTAFDGDQSAEPILTPEDARTALIEMFDRPDDGNYRRDFLEELLPDLKKEPIKRQDADHITIGPWRCNLTRRWWSAELLFPNAPRHRMNHWSGEFELSADGKWRAKVTSFESAS
jgi:hypothetical protein